MQPNNKFLVTSLLRVFGWFLRFHPYMHLFSWRKTFFMTLYTRYTHAHHVPHTEHVESCQWVEMVKHKCRAVLHLFHPWVSAASKVNCSGWSRLLSCHLSSFCWAVNRLPYLWTHSLACSHRLSSESIAIAPWTTRARKVYKVCVASH